MYFNEFYVNKSQITLKYVKIINNEEVIKLSVHMPDRYTSHRIVRFSICPQATIEQKITYFLPKIHPNSS